MKKMKKALSIICAALIAGTCFTACSRGNENAHSANYVQLYYWKSGLGLEFMQQTVNKFNEIQDEYEVELSYDADASAVISSLSLREDNEYDLYFTMLNTHIYDEDFENLDGLLDSSAYGETNTIREKYYDYLLEGFSNPDGTTHFLNYGNTLAGLIYNVDVINGTDYKLPKTTKELETLTIELSGDGKTPWIFYNDSYQNGYWNYMMYAWAAQYEGLDTYYKEILNLDKEGMTIKEKLLEKDGRYEALKVLESILTPTYAHPESTSTNFTKVQTRYLSGDAVMTVNGSWLLKETNLSANVAMMKTPVISSIVDKLEAEPKMSDKTLSAVIDAVDENETWSETATYNGVTVSENDFNRIKEARNVIASNGAEQFVFIPKYSPAKEGAKEFLKFFYSDEGTAIFSRATKLPAPVKLNDESKIDTSTYPLWNRVQFDLIKTAKPVSNKLSRHEYYINNNCDIMNGLTYAQLLIAANPVDRRGADDLFDIMRGKVELNFEGK